MRLGEADFQQHTEGSRNERGIGQTCSIDDSQKSDEGPEMGHRMLVADADEWYEHVDGRFDQWTSSEFIYVAVYLLESEGALRYSIRIMVIDDLIHEVLNLARQIICTRQTIKPSDSLAHRWT